MDEILKKLVESKIKMSIFSPRKIPVLFRLFKDAGGDITKYKDKNYARDPKHLVILNGFELQSVPLIQPAAQPPLPSISPILPPISMTTAQTTQINAPNNQANPQATNAKLGPNIVATASQNNPSAQLPTVSMGNPSSQTLTSSTGPVTSSTNPVISVGNPNIPGQQRPSMQNTNPRMPNVNLVQRQQGPRPGQAFQNQPNTSTGSPSDILRKQLTNNPGGKGAQAVRTQGPRPTMSPVGGKGSQQTQMRPGQKQMPGKQLPDSSVGPSSTSAAASQLPMGGQISTSGNTMPGMSMGQQRPENSTLKGLLNQAPVSQRQGNPTNLTSTLRHTLTQ